jgi:cell division protein FtsL
MTASAEKFIHTNVLARQHVRRRTDVSRKDLACIICMGAVIMMAFFMFIWVRIYSLEIGYRISDLHKVQEELVQENKKLKVERAALRSSSRIEMIAVNRLGMIVPRKSQVVSVPW